MAAKVDPEKLDASIRAMIEKMKPGLHEPGIKGVLARMQTMVTPALTQWRSGEVNRSTDPNDVANALILLFGTTLSSEACAIFGMFDVENPDEHFGFVNDFLQGLGEEIAAMLQRPPGLRINNVSLDGAAGTA